MEQIKFQPNATILFSSDYPDYCRLFGIDMLNLLLRLLPGEQIPAIEKRTERPAAGTYFKV